VKRIIVAGVVTGISDGWFSSVLSAVFYGSTVTRLFQGVAATLLDRQANPDHLPLVGAVLRPHSVRRPANCDHHWPAIPTTASPAGQVI
jgi:hypothetical protein